MPRTDPQIERLDAATPWSTPLWLSHHQADQAQRCTVIAGHHVCRRCLILYPLTVVVAAVVARTGSDGSWVSGLLILLSMVPFVVDWTLDQLQRIRYSSRRSGWVSALAAVGLGTALGIHLRHPFQVWVVVPVAMVVAIALVTAMKGALHRRSDREHGTTWSTAFEADEAQRLERLEALVGMIEGTDD